MAGRSGIPHLYDLTQEQIDKIIEKPTLTVSEKIDGASLTFGRDSKGECYVAGGAGTPVYDPEDFVKYTAAKTDDRVRLERAKGYANMAKLAIAEICTQLNDGEEVTTEIMMREIAVKEGDGYKFVKTVYPSSMFNKPYVVWLINGGKIRSSKSFEVKTMPKAITVPNPVGDIFKGHWKALESLTSKKAKLDYLKDLEAQAADKITHDNKAKLIATFPEGFVCSGTPMFKLISSSFRKSSAVK